MKRANQHRKAQSSLLIVLGAFIVFITFVVKEGLADKFKDSVAILEQTQETFGLREVIAHLRFVIFNSDATNPTEPAFVRTIRLANIGNDFIEENLDTISQVLIRVEAGNDLWRRFDTLKQERLKEKWEYRKLQDELLGRNGQQAKSLLEIRVEVEALTPTGDRLREEEQTLKTDIMNRAKERRDRDERYYKISKFAGWFLYAIGWCLGLVGKVREGSVQGTE